MPPLCALLKRFNKPLLAQPEFWHEEKDASILLLDKGLVAKAKERDSCQGLFDLADQWCEAANVTAQQTKREVLALDQQIREHERTGAIFKRIFVKDAERTFRKKHNQDILMHILTIMEGRMGDYHQGG